MGYPDQQTVGIIATLLYTIPLVLTVDYIAFVMIDGDDPRNFFSGNMMVHLFYIILSAI